MAKFENKSMAAVFVLLGYQGSRKNVKYECTGKPRTGWFAVRYKIADKLVFSRIRAALAMDRMNFAFSGGGLSPGPRSSFSSAWGFL